MDIPKITMPKIAQPAWDWLKGPTSGTKIAGPLTKTSDYFGKIQASGVGKLVENEKSLVGNTKFAIGSKGMSAVNILGKVPKGVPVIAAGLATLFEIPKIIHNLPLIGRDKDDGRFLDQTAESTCKVAGTTAGAWAGYAAGAATTGAIALKFGAAGTLLGGPVGTAVGLAAGIAVGLTVALTGSKIGDFVGTTLFGKKEETNIAETLIPQDNLYNTNTIDQMFYDPMMINPYSMMDSYSTMYPEYAAY